MEPVQIDHCIYIRNLINIQNSTCTSSVVAHSYDSGSEGPKVIRPNRGGCVYILCMRIYVYKYMHNRMLVAFCGHCTVHIYQWQECS